MVSVTKTRRKDVFRGIRASINRFLSILFIVALGAGFLAGLFATTPDMRETTDAYMDEYNWYDFDIKATLGLTQEDVDALAALDCLAQVQPANVMDMVLTDKNNSDYAARLYAFFDQEGKTPLNQVELTQGRMPQSESECVLQVSGGGYAGNSMPQPGDVLTLAQANKDYDELADSMAATELTVVGIVQSPMCISIASDSTTVGSGSLALHVYVMEDFFEMDDGIYTDAYLTVAGAKEVNTFDDEYFALIDAAEATLDAFGEERAALRTQQLRQSAQEEIDSAQDALDALEQLAGTQEALLTDRAQRAMQTSQAAPLLAMSGTNEGAALAGALAEEAQGVQTALEEKQAEAEESESEDALQEQRDAVADAQAELDALEDGVWLINTREDSVGFSSYQSDVEKVAALCKVFPMFFFLVALLVALTTMTRLVEENRTQIGTLKALGFSNGQVLFEYLLYSFLSSLLGCALGFIGGFKLLPAVISDAYGMMYVLPKTVTPLRPDIMLIIAPVTIGCILLATLWACFSVTHACPAVLMVPKAPAPGKRILLERIPFFWNRLTFTRKVTCRNLFRYKKRLFMTVIGVAGCSALLLAGFGMRDSIHDIVDIQFGEIEHYDLMLLLDEPGEAQNDPAVVSLLEDSSMIADSLFALNETGNVIFKGESCSVTMFVPQDAQELSDFVTLRERLSGEPIGFGEGSVVLTEKLCETMGIKVGDTVTLEDSDGRQGTAKVTGITENYITAYAYVSPDVYQSLFGKPAEYASVFCQLSEGTQPEDAMRSALSSGHVLYTRSTQNIQDTFVDTVGSIDAIVLVLILAAGMLCIVVLYNLTNVNICERRKELATIRVLGFYDREVERYIFRETNLLSFFGAVLGLGFGIWLHAYVVKTVEVDALMFGRVISPMSYVYSLVITMIFTLFVNLIMRSSIRKVDMVESMKAND